MATIINGVGKVGVRQASVSPAPVTPSYPSSLKLFIDAGNPLSYPGSGSVVTDLIGTQNGTLINGTGWSSSNGGTFTFDGINDYINFPLNTTITPVASATYSIWLNLSGVGTPWSFQNDATGYNGIKLMWDNGGVRYISANNSSQQIYGFSSFPSAILNNWYYLTLSFNGTSAKIYINGVLKTTYSQTFIPTNGVKPFRIGNMNGDNWPMNGKIAQMKIYNTQLSDAEVTTDFNEFKSRYGY